MTGDNLAFPWARTYDADQLSAFVDDLWGAASGDNDLATLDAIEKAIAEHRPVIAPAPNCPLTRRQLAVLIGAANGEHVEDTARRLGLRDTGVHAHRGRAYRRLGVRTLAQAVAVCVARRWIPSDALHLPDLPSLPPHGSERYRDQAALLRQQPGDWQTVGTYDTNATARITAYRIRSATLAAFRPRGAYEALHTTENGVPAVRARYIGTPASTQKAAS